MVTCKLTVYCCPTYTLSGTLCSNFRSGILQWEGGCWLLVMGCGTVPAAQQDGFRQVIMRPQLSSTQRLWQLKPDPPVSRTIWESHRTLAWCRQPSNAASRRSPGVFGSPVVTEQQAPAQQKSFLGQAEVPLAELSNRAVRASVYACLRVRPASIRPLVCMLKDSDACGQL